MRVAEWLGQIVPNTYTKDLSECCFTSTETVGLLGTGTQTATSAFTQLLSSDQGLANTGIYRLMVNSVQVISAGALPQVGETYAWPGLLSGLRGRWCGHFVFMSDVLRLGRIWNGDAEIASDAGMVRGDRVGHGSRLHKVHGLSTAGPGCGVCHGWTRK